MPRLMMDPDVRQGLHTLAGVLRLLSDKIAAVASGVGPHGDLENAAAVLEGQARVLRDWISVTTEER